MKKQAIKFKYDKLARALYMKVGNGKVAKTEETSSCFLVDYDKEGKIIGVEMLNVGKEGSNKFFMNIKELQKV